MLLISNLPPLRSTPLKFLFISRDFVNLYPQSRNRESALTFYISSSVSLLHLFLNYLRELNHNVHSLMCLYICAFIHATKVYRWHNLREEPWRFHIVWWICESKFFFFFFKMIYTILLKKLSMFSYFYWQYTSPLTRICASNHLFHSLYSYFNYFIGVWLIYNVVLVSAEQQYESVTHTHKSPPF